MKRLLATDFRDPSGIIVESAQRVADAIVGVLQTDGEVIVSMEGMAGVSSAFFNSIIKAVQQKVGENAIHCIHFEFTSELQKQIYERSRIAIIHSQAGM